MATPCGKRSNNGDLPEDIVLDILLRLPVKTLLRFKCVCKHWYTLIGSQRFVNLHFCHENNRERLLVRYYIPDYDSALALFFDDMLSGYEKPDHLQMNRNTVMDLIGPVNGVFCVFGPFRNIALLNPATRQFKPLPPKLDVQSMLIEDAHGFGLDSLNGDFKVVSIEYFWKREKAHGHFCPLVSIYNSGSDSWRHFEDASLHTPIHRPRRSPGNTYLHGVYYWLLELYYSKISAILAFDMTTEKFQEIQVPDCTKLKRGNLALYGDSIALLVYEFKEDACTDVWIMQTEGSWSRRATIGPFECTFPLGFWKNNELLLCTRSPNFALCNIYTQKLRTVEFEAGSIGNYYLSVWVFSYKESLVSIKGEGGNCIVWDPESGFV